MSYIVFQVLGCIVLGIGSRAFPLVLSMFLGMVLGSQLWGTINNIFDLIFDQLFGTMVQYQIANQYYYETQPNSYGPRKQVSY